jgi:hypothetical protein
MSSDRSCSEQSDLFLIRLRIDRVHESIICILRALPVRIRFGVADPPITILPGEVRWLKEGRISTPPGLPVAFGGSKAIHSPLSYSTNALCDGRQGALYGQRSPSFEFSSSSCHQSVKWKTTSNTISELRTTRSHSGSTISFR